MATRFAAAQADRTFQREMSPWRLSLLSDVALVIESAVSWLNALALLGSWTERRVGRPESEGRKMLSEEMVTEDVSRSFGAFIAIRWRTALWSHETTVTATPNGI